MTGPSSREYASRSPEGMVAGLGDMTTPRLASTQADPPRGCRRAWGGPALRLLFAHHLAHCDGSGEQRTTPWRARGKLAGVRRAAPRPARHPLGGSAQVLLRRGAVMSGTPETRGRHHLPPK